MKVLLNSFCIFLSLSLFAQQKGVTPLSERSPLDKTQNSPLETSETYAVVVGISDYQDEGIPDLRFADRDAEAFAGFLQSPAGGNLDEDHLKVLINEQATVAQFAIALDWLWEVVKENDRVIIYFSGHGDVERKSITQPGYLLCWDAPSKIYLAGGALALPMFQDVITTLSAQNKAKVIVITDACRSGKLSGSSVGGSKITGSNLAKQYANEIKILSCQPDEYSIEGEQWGGGRGAFSYHLLDGLYGMADGNGDASVSLKEIGRYLEDRVSEEVAPQNQNPMTIGNVAEKLTEVFPDILEELKEGKKGQLQLFTATESRGIEDEVLAAADSNIVEIYLAFKQSIKEKQFLKPATFCADYYYEKLSQEPQLEKLHSTIRRNYAAALQDDAQQVMNRFIKTGLDQDMNKKRLPQMVFSKKVQTFPRLLDRAAELLGEDHYMYPTLQARKYFFEGYILANSDANHNEELGNNALAYFKQALKWQPELPQAYLQMSRVYGNNLRMIDTAEVYAQKAMDLHPSWVMPYTDLVYILLLRHRQFEKAKYYLEQAEKIDSNYTDIYACWGIYYTLQHDMASAEKNFRKLVQLDSTNAGNYASLANLYFQSYRLDEAEKYAKKAIGLDSTIVTANTILGTVYALTRRYDQAERTLKMVIRLDSTFFDGYNSLAFVYKGTGRYDQAIKCYKKVIELDSTISMPYNNLGSLYLDLGLYEEAEKYFNKIFEFDETSWWMAYANLGVLHQKNQRWKIALENAEKAIELAPQMGGLYAMLGDIYMHLPGRFDEARAELDKALQMAPTWPGTYISLAYWYLSKNQPGEAWNYLEQGIKKGYKDYKYLQSNPDFTEMWKDVKWTALMKKYYPEESKN